MPRFEEIEEEFDSLMICCREKVGITDEEKNYILLPSISEALPKLLENIILLTRLQAASNVRKSLLSFLYSTIK